MAQQSCRGFAAHAAGCTEDNGGAPAWFAGFVIALACHCVPLHGQFLIGEDETVVRTILAGNAPMSPNFRAFC
jgi:hypothetical protein